MNPPRVICVGEILFDCLANELGRSLPEVSSWNPFPGGAPANVACALARLGVESAWIGCVGDDEAGAALLGVLRSRGVDITGAQIHPTAPTRQVFVTRSLAGEREFAGFGDRPTTEFADAFLRADSLPESLFVTADILAAGTLGLAYPETRAALERSLALASQHGMQIAIDLNWRPVFWPDPDSAPAIVRAVLPYADYLKCSDEEARWLFGTDDPTAIAAQLPRARGIAVTRGERGCAYTFGSHAGNVSAFIVRAIDTTGAGDSFLAGWLHGILRSGAEAIAASSELARQTIEFACAAGALTTMKAGAIAAQPTLSDINTLIADRDRRL